MTVGVADGVVEFGTLLADVLLAGRRRRPLAPELIAKVGVSGAVDVDMAADGRGRGCSWRLSSS